MTTPATISQSDQGSRPILDQRSRSHVVPDTAETKALPLWLWPRAAYVHVPFCAHHCGYCDFAIATGQDHAIELYLDALAAEIATLGEPRPVRTLFIEIGRAHV